MNNNFWEKPSLVEVFLILLSTYFVFSALPNFNLFYRENPQSFVYDFQQLLIGLFTFIAAFTALIAARATIRNERYLANVHREHEEKIVNLELKEEQKKEKRIEKKFRTYYRHKANKISEQADLLLKNIEKKKLKAKTIKLLLFDYDLNFFNKEHHIIYFNSQEIEKIIHLEKRLSKANFAKITIEYLISKKPDSLAKDLIPDDTLNTYKEVKGASAELFEIIK